MLLILGVTKTHATCVQGLISVFTKATQPKPRLPPTPPATKKQPPSTEGDFLAVQCLGLVASCSILLLRIMPVSAPPSVSAMRLRSLPSRASSLVRVRSLRSRPHWSGLDFAPGCLAGPPGAGVGRRHSSRWSIFLVARFFRREKAHGITWVYFGFVLMFVFTLF